MILLKQLGMNLKISTKFIHIITRFKSINYNQTCIKFYEICSLKLTYPSHNLHRKYCDRYFKDEDYTDSESEDIDYKRNIKNIILPNNDDTLAIKLNECKSSQEIFELLKHNNDQLNWKNISMALAMIRELQIIFYRVCMLKKNINLNTIHINNNFENILTNYDFLNLLNLIEKHYKLMNIQCLSYSILCLHKLGINFNYIINQKLSERLKIMLKSTPIEEIQCSVLSRFTVTIVNNKNLSNIYILKDIWPIILNKISKYRYILFKK